MSLVNPSKVADHISNWIKDYATKNNRKTLVYGLSGGIDSALVALLCKKTGIPTLAVNMPCHSSDSAFKRAETFAKEYNLPLVKVDLSKAHDVIFGQTKETIYPNFSNNRIAEGGLRSCLRAPTLSYYSNATQGIIVGTGNRSEDNITRYFQKYGDGCVDISPISDLFKGEVYELFSYLAKQMSDLMDGTGNMPPAAQAIYDAKPTADLWGPDSGQEDEKELGISYDEIEWGDRENMRTEEDTLMSPGIVCADSDPAKHPAWLGYTGRQREVIAKLHHLEKVSRHKINASLPVCYVRHDSALVR